MTTEQANDGSVCVFIHAEFSSSNLAERRVPVCSKTGKLVKWLLQLRHLIATCAENLCLPRSTFFFPVEPRKNLKTTPKLLFRGMCLSKIIILVSFCELVPFLSNSKFKYFPYSHGCMCSIKLVNQEFYQKFHIKTGWYTVRWGKWHNGLCCLLYSTCAGKNTKLPQVRNHLYIVNVKKIQLLHCQYCGKK